MLKNKEGNSVRIVDDCDPQSPRDWENFGTMILFHRRYALGDQTDTTQEQLEWIVNDIDTVSLPVYGYEHSGFTIATAPFSCPWDSGKLGYIYVTKQSVVEAFGAWTAETQEKAKAILQAEVEAYDNYLTGSVYGFQIYNEDNELVDSCYGFFGDDHKASGLLESAGVE